MAPQTAIRWRYLWILVSGIAIVLFAFLFLYTPIGWEFRTWVFFLTHPKHLSVAGVVQTTDGTPVKDAKVIVVAHDSKNLPWDSSSHSFGTMSDDRGRFSVDKQLDFRISRVDVGACSPSDEYTYVQIHDKNSLTKFHTIVVSKAKGKEYKIRYSEYFNPPGEIELIGKDW